MKRLCVIPIILVALLMFFSTVSAGEYAWMRDFNMRAAADLADFRARLETRFKIGDLEIDAVFDTTHEPADAYMLLRLGEMADEPIGKVIDAYKVNKGHGWGNLAKRLGIKPGSSEFHALKQGQDLYGDMGTGQGSHKDKAKKKSKDKD